MTFVYKEHEVKIETVLKQWLQLKKAFLGYYKKLLFSLRKNPCRVE